ncbi:MAG: hypothetical protein EBV57_04820 [Betaproteobacteria bacterium]|jgi:hypothetical protein|nr:hypothetical protein [Betaproteobacteria bacterium]
MRVIMRVRRDAVNAKDRRSPGYRAAVESVAVGGDDTHYDVPREAYVALVRQHATAVVSARRLPRIAVGDLVERMLTGIGISKDRVRQWLRVKDCGCAKRQRWLNQWGYKQQDKIERLLNRAARWYGLN